MVQHVTYVPCYITNDHYWKGGTCTECGERLRCDLCGQYLHVDRLDDHFDHCIVLANLDEEGDR